MVRTSAERMERHEREHDDNSGRDAMNLREHPAIYAITLLGSLLVRVDMLNDSRERVVFWPLRKVGISGRSELSAFFLEDLLLPAAQEKSSAE